MRVAVAIFLLLLAGCDMAEKKVAESNLPPDMNQWTMKDWDRFWESPDGKAAKKKIELRETLERASGSPFRIGILGL